VLARVRALIAERRLGTLLIERYRVTEKGTGKGDGGN